MTHTASPPSSPGLPTPLRIALVTETWPPEINGVAATVSRVVDGLRERRHHVQLVRPRQAADGAAHGSNLAGAASTATSAATEPESGAAGDAVLVRSLPIPRYPHLRMGAPAGRLLRECWREEAPDVVHIATEGPLGWSALGAALRLGLPVTSDFRTNFHAYSRHYGAGWLKRPIEAYLRHFHNRAHATMVPTEALRRELEAAGFERTTTVARGVDTLAFGPAHRSEALRRSWGAEPADTVVLCVGRLAPEKNLDTLLLAFEAMCMVNRRLHLVLVGDGPQRAEIAARCPRAVLAGQRRGDDLAAHFASADLFLFPSLTETFGNVTPEALASGLPVLAFDYAAASQLVRPGVNGALVARDDPAGFIDQAQRWAAEPRAARAMGSAARLTALGLDWSRIICQIEAVFLATMAAQRSRASAAVAAGWGVS
jgi:glycosyltransferase involved in cell wall biosynthesis